MKIVVKEVDTSETSLGGTASAIEAAAFDFMRELESDGFDILDLSVLPHTARYSTPDPDSYRDFHYAETGFMLVAKVVQPQTTA